MIMKDNIVGEEFAASVRLMTGDDLAQVMEIEKEVFSDPWEKELFNQEMEMNSSFVLVENRIEGERILGYFCGIQVLDEYMLTNIAVAKEYLGKGLGSKMLDYLLADLFKKAVRTCFLEVRRSNEKAINLYLKKSFIPVGVRKGYYKNPLEDAVIMKRIL